MIVVKPFGGLGNQLRVLRCACRLAQDTNQQLSVIWTGCCSFNDIIESLPVEPVEVKNYYDASLKYLIQKGKLIKALKTVLGEKSLNRYLKRWQFIYEYDWMKPIQFVPEVMEKLKSGVDFYLPNCMPFYKEDCDYEGFCFSKNAEAKADELLEKASGRKLYGIHYRGTDHVGAKAKSPMSLFMTLMGNLAEKEDAVFFVATDEPEFLAMARSNFGDRVLTFDDKVWSRWDGQGQIDALTEMLCLSKCSHIYGSFESSFSEEAARIGGIDKTVLEL